MLMLRAAPFVAVASKLLSFCVVLLPVLIIQDHSNCPSFLIVCLSKTKGYIV